jgi:hypothetical protein
VKKEQVNVDSNGTKFKHINQLTHPHRQQIVEDAHGNQHFHLPAPGTEEAFLATVAKTRIEAYAARRMGLEEQSGRQRRRCSPQVYVPAHAPPLLTAVHSDTQPLSPPGTMLGGGVPNVPLAQPSPLASGYTHGLSVSTAAASSTTSLSSTLTRHHQHWQQRSDGKVQLVTRLSDQPSSSKIVDPSTGRYMTQETHAAAIATRTEG